MAVISDFPVTVNLSVFIFSDFQNLCSLVWPALAMVGGVDNGLRMGGRCIHKQTSREATMLGVLKEGGSSAKVQWDDNESTIR